MSWLDRINEQDQADPSFRPSYDTPLPFEGSDVAAGAERGGFGLRSALSGAVGDTRGAEYYGARAAGTPTRFNSYKDVDPLSLDVIDYVQQVGGEQAPNMALMAATGGVAGAAAKSLMAGRVGAGAASGMMQFGEMSNELRQQGLEPTAVTAGAAALGGALDVIGLESLTKGMLKSAVGEQIKSEVQANAATRALRGAFGGFIEGVKNELPAELSQEVLAVGNRAYSDPNYLKKTDEIADRFAETAAATTAFAGPLGAAPGAVGGMRSATPEAPPVTPGASDTSLLDRVRGTPAPSNDMTLEELRALDSSTSSGETYGESQNAAKESTLPPNENGKRQEVLKDAGASAPATSSRAQRAFQYFQDKGLPSHTAAGIVGALTGESSRELSPGIVNPNSGAFGIAQWLGSRVKELDAFAKARGKPVDDFDTQLDFVWHELNNKEAGAFAQVKKAPDALTASDLFTTKFERPGKHELRLEPRRAAALDLLNGKAVGTTQAQAGATTVVQQRAENPALTAAENAEMARRKAAEEPTYQSTTLGRSISENKDEFGAENTDDGFSLTFKGTKAESTGDELFRPSRSLPEANPDTFEGSTTESTPVRAFSEVMYPGAKVTETSDPTDFTKIVSVALPKTDALSDNDKLIARESLGALVSGVKADPAEKIVLEHPNVVSSKSDNPIEIPVTRNGLAKIGRALDPGAYDDKPASAYAAAMSGLTHLIYDKGFVPRGVDTSKPNALEAWVKQQIGEQPVDRTPERAIPEQEDRPVTGPVMGTARAEGQTPVPEAGGFTGEDPAPRVEFEPKPGYTPVQQAALNHITVEAKRIQQTLPPDATDEDRVKAWESAVNQVVRQTNPETIRVAPETAYYELGNDGKPQRIVTQSDTDGAPGNPNVDAAVLGREFESPEQARQALASAGYESLPQLKGPRQFVAMKEANKSTFRLVKTPEGKFRLTTGNKPTPGLSRPKTVTRKELIQIADLAKQEFSSALYARRMNAERDQINQEAGQNPESMPLRDELMQDQTLAAEGQIGIAEDRAAMAQRQRGLTSSFSPTEAKDQTRRSTENAINRVEDTAKRTRELDNQSIETVHKVSGGATIRATGVAEQVVKFFSDALKNIGLEVPLRVMSKAGIGQHLEALQQRIDGLVEAITREEEALQRMPNMLKEEKKARKEQEKKVATLRRAFQDANTEQGLLMQALEDEFAARVIYNDHYLDAARRTPVIVISDEAMSSKNLNVVLAHELGHVVQRAWFDQLPADLQKDIIKELSQDGRYTDDIAEAFADKFMEWYRLNEAGDFNRKQQAAYAPSGKIIEAFKKLYAHMLKLWQNLKTQDKAFRHRYPKFDEFLRSTVGVYGKMKPINPRINRLWTESLAQPYGGLPLAVANQEQFNNMTAGELAQTAVDGAKAGIDRAARYAENKAGENIIGQRYLRKTNETVDAFKKMAAVALMADGTWLRNAGNGLLAGYANIVAPIKGRVMENMQVIPKTLVRPALSAREPAVYASTNALNGSIQTLSDQQYGAWRKRLDPILEKVSKLSSNDYKDLLANLRDETGLARSPLVREVRNYFAQMLMFMRAHDVKVGARSGYYTKAWDLIKLDDNKDAVIDDFERVFAAREELPVDPRVKVREGQEPVKFSTARAAALYEYQRITTGRVDNLFEQTEEDVDPELRGPSFRYARKRMFSDDEYKTFGLDKWLNDDIAWTMNTYTLLGIKRAVQQQATGIPREQRRNPVTRRYWEQRFTKAKLLPEVMGSPVAALELLVAEGVQDGRLSHDEYVEAKKRIMSVMGLTNVGSNPRARRWVNRVLAYETLLTMTWSSFAQLADFGISIWRADSMDRVGKVIGQMMDKRTRGEQQELLRTIGLSLDELTRHALNSGLMTTDPMAKGTQILTEKFFRLNGMHFLSEANLTFSSMLGQSYIKDYADKAVNGKTMEERDEAMKRLRELHPTLSPADALTGDFAANPLLQQALHEYVSQSHLHNQIGYTPRIFNDYRFSVFTQLKGFMFKYHNIVLRQMWERMKDRPDLFQAAIPMLTLAAATMPLAFAGMEAKEALRRRLFPKVKRAPKEKTPMQKFHDVLMASGMPGAYVGLFDSALEAPQHGQPGIVALAGPTVGHAFNISSRTADEWLPSSVPIVSSVPWIRSMARQGLRDTFGFGVRDEE